MRDAGRRWNSWNRADVPFDGQEGGSFPREGTRASWRRAGTSGFWGRSLLQSLALSFQLEGGGSDGCGVWRHMIASVWAAVTP